MVHKIVLLYHHFTFIYNHSVNITITIKYFKSIHNYKHFFYVSNYNFITVFLVEIISLASKILPNQMTTH